MKTRGLIIAGTQSSSGKTALTSMLLAALKSKNVPIQPFKVGPDFIDPGYHKTFSGEDSVNLDSWIMGESEIRKAAERFTQNKVGIVEGVMGLFDGANPDDDQGSTMEIARWLQWPVLLVVDASHAGRSIFASIRGFVEEAGPGAIAGVILNWLGSEGHETYLKKACAGIDISVYGMLPKISELQWPERHLGLQASQEQEFPNIEILSEKAENHLDLDGILDLMEIPDCSDFSNASDDIKMDSVKTIGVARDEAFHFYYRANLEWLKTSGAEMVQFSPLKDSELPQNLDGLLIGGGFPEIYAETMSENHSMRQSLKKAIVSGMPCYAECGGLMLLAESLQTREGRSYPMTGMIPGSVRMTERLQHFGYCQARFEEGGTFRGHEFHYSNWEEESNLANAWTVRRHADGSERKEGYQRGNLHASYVHLYFPKAAQVLSPLFGLD